MARGPRRRSGEDPIGPVVLASSVISWAQRRAGWVRKLLLKGEYGVDKIEVFSFFPTSF